MIFLCISLVENQTPCVWHVFKTFQVKLALVYLKYYGFCVFNQVRLYPETEETKPKLQRKRIQLPKRPFYIRSDHP